MTSEYLILITTPVFMQQDPDNIQARANKCQVYSYPKGVIFNKMQSNYLPLILNHIPIPDIPSINILRTTTDQKLNCHINTMATRADQRLEILWLYLQTSRDLSTIFKAHFRSVNFRNTLYLAG